MQIYFQILKYALFIETRFEQNNPVMQVCLGCNQRMFTLLNYDLIDNSHSSGHAKPL